MNDGINKIRFSFLVREKTVKKILAIALAALFLSVCAFPFSISAPAYALGDIVKPENASDFLGDGYGSDGEKIDSLSRIIKLNVTNAEKIPVLLYHHLAYEKDIPSAEKNSASIMPVERFRAQMKYLYDNGYYAASLAELEMYIKGETILPERSVVITFDDGYKSNAVYAYPLLKRYHFKAAIFMISRLIGESGEKVFLGWNDFAACKDVFTYGSHTHDLHKRRENGRTDFVTMSRAIVEKDVAYSREILETAYFAYPHGQIGGSSKNILEAAGYRMAFNITEGYVEPGSDPLEIPRFTITPFIEDDLFQAIVGGTADV